MKYLSILFYVATSTFILALLFGVDIKISPFSLKVTRLYEGIGIILFAVGLAVYNIASEKRKVNEELGEIKTRFDSVQTKVNNCILIDKDKLPNEPFTLTLTEDNRKYFIVPFPSLDSTLKENWEDDILTITFEKQDTAAVFMDVNGEISATNSNPQ